MQDNGNESRLRSLQLLLALAALATIGFSTDPCDAQTTYTWNVSGAGAWGTAANWAPTRTTPAANDILVFDGSVTPTCTANQLVTQTIGKLLLTNNAQVSLLANAGAVTLTVAGGTGVDFEVQVGSALYTMGSTITIQLGAAATGLVTGDIHLPGGSHRFLATGSNSLVFGSGGRILAESGFTGSVFGTTALNTVDFLGGSEYVSAAGANPFGAAAPQSVVTFEAGSRYTHQQTAAPSLSGRTYADFQLNAFAYNQVSTGTQPFIVDDLTITVGQMHLQLTDIGIRGDVYVAGGAMLDFNPTAAQTVRFNGLAAQTVAHDGSLTFNSSSGVFFQNLSGVTLSHLVTFSGSTIIDPGARLITQSLVTNSGTLVVNGTFQLESGGSASGNNFTYAPVSALVFNNGTTINYSGQPYWAGPSSPQSVVVQGGGNVNVGAPPPVIRGVLTLSSGILTASAGSPIIIGQGATVSGGSAASHINGYLQKYVDASGAPSTTVFEIGDPSRYTPVSLDLPSVTAGGYILASTTATDHVNIGTSGLDPFRSVNRTWDLVNLSATIPPASITFTFDPTDLDPGTDPSSFEVRTFNPPDAWTAQTAGTRNSTSTQATGVTTLGAFAIANRDWVVQVSHGPNGGISPNQTVYVSDGSDQHFDITPDPCFTVEDVLVDSVSVGPVTEYTFVDVTQDHTISATFGPGPGSTITASAGTGGSINPDGAVSVMCGADTTFTIAPDSCHTIAEVLVDGSSIGAVTDYTFTNVTANHTISASFALIPYTITASADPNGSISPSGVVSVDCGEDETFTITPDPFYSVVDVIVDGLSVGAVASYTFTGVSEDHTISASFGPISGQCCGGWSFVHGTFADYKQQAAAVYDPNNDRMIIHGGNGVIHDVWAVSLSSPYMWTELSPAGPHPDGRMGHAAVFDPVGRRMVEFGGTDLTTTFNDVWALSLDGIPSWTDLTPTSGPTPSPRKNHSAVYDVPNHRIVVFGGMDASGALLNEVWVLSLAGSPSWTQMSPGGTPPSARYQHSAIYDPDGMRMVVFGGHDGGQLNDVWALSLAGPPTWTDITPEGEPPNSPPLGREGHTAIYDSSGHQMVIYGGIGDTSIWMLSLTGTPKWTSITPLGSCPSRRYHTAVYDPTSSTMFFSSGLEMCCGDLRYRSGDLWEVALTGSPVWIDHTPIAARDVRRADAAVVFDPVGQRMLLFGGEDPSLTTDHVWSFSFDETAWTDITPAGNQPPLGLMTSAIYDPDGERMVFFGGDTYGSGFLNHVWSLSLSGTPEWTNITPPSGPAPAGRVGHGMAYDPTGHRLLVYGGSQYSLPFNDIWALSLTGTPQWTQITPAGPSPPARAGHSLIYEPTSQRMIVYGGSDSYTQLTDVWALSLSGTPAWSNITPGGGGPDARLGQVAILDPAAGTPRMILFGGQRPDQQLLDGLTNDVWSLSLTGTPVWTDITPPAFGPTPPPRRSHAAFYDPYTASMVIHGGWVGMAANTIWSLCLNQGVYTITATAGSGGSISPPGVTTLPPDCGQTYTITPDYGYVIAEVLVDGVPQGALNTYTFPDVQGNHTIEATFAPNISSVPAAIPTTLRLEGVQVFSSGATGIKVTFVLPSEAPARLELLDVTGRRIADQEVASGGAGRKTVDLTGRRLPASGIYWLRLVQGRETRVAKVFIVR